MHEKHFQTKCSDAGFPYNLFWHRITRTCQVVYIFGNMIKNKNDNRHMSVCAGTRIKMAKMAGTQDASVTNC